MYELVHETLKKDAEPPTRSIRTERTAFCLKWAHLVRDRILRSEPPY